MRRHNTPLLLAAAAVLTGLGSAQAETALMITGSERMTPLLRVLAGRFTELHPDVKVTVSADGSDAGIEALEDGTATIAALARPVSREEVERFRFLARRDLIGVPVAMDVVCLFVHPDNPLTSLTTGQINRVLNGKINRWAELGVAMAPALPDEHAGDQAPDHSRGPLIRRHIPPLSSGPPHVLRTRVMSGKGLSAPRVEHGRLRDVVDAVAQDRIGLGFGFADAGYTRRVKVLAIRKDEDAPPVVPTPETIRSRAYPLSHYLYLYFAGWPTGPVGDFLTFAISPEGQGIISQSRTGVVTLPLHCYP